MSEFKRNVVGHLSKQASKQTNKDIGSTVPERHMLYGQGKG